MESYKISKSPPLLFYSIVIIGVLSLCGLWFFLHPNSPWHTRNYYNVSFKEVGALKVGNTVTVNGLTYGYVEELDLTDSCVWAKIAVLAQIKIPTDSKLLVTNVGLMGERAVNILIGDSLSYYESGARITGFFDIGGTDIGKLAVDVLDELHKISNKLSYLSDSVLFSEQKKGDYERISKKAKILGNRISHVANSTGDSISVLFDSLNVAKNKITVITDNLKTELDKLSKNADLIKNDFDSLEKNLEKLITDIRSIAEKLESGDNTLALTIDKDGILRQELNNISDDATKLMEKIRDRGLDLNVDIF